MHDNLSHVYLSPLEVILSCNCSVCRVICYVKVGTAVAKDWPYFIRLVLWFAKIQIVFRDLFLFHDIIIQMIYNDYYH